MNFSVHAYSTLVFTYVLLNSVHEVHVSVLTARQAFLLWFLLLLQMSLDKLCYTYVCLGVLDKSLFPESLSCNNNDGIVVKQLWDFHCLNSSLHPTVYCMYICVDVCAVLVLVYIHVYDASGHVTSSALCHQSQVNPRR